MATGGRSISRQHRFSFRHRFSASLKNVRRRRVPTPTSLSSPGGWRIFPGISLLEGEHRRRRIVHWRGNSRRLGVARDSATQRSNLRRSTCLYIQQKAWLGARRERVDRTDGLRSFVGCEGDAAGARDVDDFLHCALQQTPAEWLLAQRAHGSARESARCSQSSDEDELLPQLELNVVRYPCVGPGLAERRRDARGAV